MYTFGLIEKERYLFQMNCKECEYKSQKANTTEALFEHAKKDGVKITTEEIKIYSQKEKKKHKVLTYSFVCPICGGNSFSLIGDNKEYTELEIEEELEEEAEDKKTKRKKRKAKVYDLEEEDDDDEEEEDEVPEGFYIEEINDSDDEEEEDD